MSDLKSCPFCISQPRDCYGYDYHKVRCSNDYCIISGVAMEKDVWNNQQRITELEARLREAVKANRLSQLIGERNAFRRVSAMNVDGWLKQKMKSEIERVTCRIEEIKKDKDHE